MISFLCLSLTLLSHSCSRSRSLPAACPWMTAAQAAITPPTTGRGQPAVPPLYNFGAACWYFAQKLTDQLEAAGKLVPIGVTDTAIGGQRIEEYMVNDTTLTACSDRTGEARCSLLLLSPPRSLSRYVCVFARADRRMGCLQPGVEREALWQTDPAVRRHDGQRLPMVPGALSLARSLCVCVYVCVCVLTSAWAASRARTTWVEPRDRRWQMSVTVASRRL